MSSSVFPLIVEPEDLERRLADPAVLVVDLSKPEVYLQSHIPGAVHLDYAQIITARRPAMGLLPEKAQLEQALSTIGLTPDLHVVAYDDEGGGRAARLLWTLEAAGHERFSLLNGGLRAWLAERRPVRSGNETRKRHPYTVEWRERVIADLDYILARLGQPDVALLDARTADEYFGIKRFAERGGHIPGAANLDWKETMDQTRALRLKPATELRAMLSALGITPDKEVICYCQSHHRSAHSYIMLKSLGYERVRGYAGSWSEWGNRPDTPVA
jgi:thiosulfate/3-mercaptopyruvate sulfurtransferase